MHAKVPIKQSIAMADMIMGSYLNDLEDADFHTRPVAGMNTIAWQLGHLIVAERSFIEGIKPGSCPALPEGFEAKHGKETATLDDPAAFHAKAEYLALWKAQREATMALLESLTDEELDAPAPERIRNLAPTVGAVLNLTGLHPLMHVGQFVAVRRATGKPVAF